MRASLALLPLVLGLFLGLAWYVERDSPTRAEALEGSALGGGDAAPAPLVPATLEEASTRRDAGGDARSAGLDRRDRPAEWATTVPYDPGSVLVRLVPVHPHTGEPLLKGQNPATHLLRGGGEKWTGQRRPGEDELLFAIDPKAPRDVALELDVGLRVGSWPAVRWRLRRPLQLVGDELIDLGAQIFEHDQLWLRGSVSHRPGTDLAGARLEVMGLLPNDSPERPFLVTASATVHPSGRFEVDAPRDAQAYDRLRARVVRADGKTIEHAELLEPFEENSQRLDGYRMHTVRGRGWYRGEPATGLFSVRVEVAGVMVGTTRVQSDGTFEVEGLPDGECDVVIESTRPRGELVRLSGIAIEGGEVVDVGDVELGREAQLVELELVDGRGKPAETTLSWSNGRRRGSERLGARDRHRLLVPQSQPYTLSVARTGDLDPLPIVDPSGVVRLVVDP